MGNESALPATLRPESRRRRWPGLLLPHLQPLALLAFTAFFLSTQMLLQWTLFDLWSWQEIAGAWLAYLAELALLALLQYGAYLGIDAACARHGVGRWARLAWLALGFYAVAFGYTLAGMLWRNHLAAPPDLPFAAALAARLAMIAIYIVGVQTLWRRVRETDALALDAQQAVAALERESQQLRLQLLKAQIEPHFLFNTLANMRQLYRAEPAAAGAMMQSLKRYLRAALPAVRRDDATLADELNLARAYLTLIGMRLRSRLDYRVVDASGCAAMGFPAMVVVTLVENAVRHGIEPAPQGGRIEVVATARGGWLSISVRDNGVGLGAAQPGGTGVGLANIRSQLRACFGRRARLSLAMREPGAEALILVPLEGS